MNFFLHIARMSLQPHKENNASLLGKDGAIECRKRDFLYAPAPSFLTSSVGPHNASHAKQAERFIPSWMWATHLC